MLQFNVRELLREDFGRDSSPEAAGGEDVGLVAAPHGGRAFGTIARAFAVLAHRGSEGSGHACAALDLATAVRPRVAGEVFFLDFRAEVGAAGVFAQEDEVRALCDGGLQG